MTTLAYRDGILAYDSRATSDNTIVDDDFNKRIKTKDANFFLCGACSDYPILIAAYYGEDCPDKVEASAFVYDGECLWTIGVQDGEFWKNEIDLSRVYAMGSGEDHAWTAMDCGLSAKDAVKMAAKRDVSTGGRIRTFKLK